MSTLVDDRTASVNVFGHILIPTLIVVLVTATRPNIMVRGATVVANAVVAYSALQTKVEVGHEHHAYAMGSFFVTNCFTAWWMLLYEDPVKNGRRINVSKQVEPKDMSLLGRMFWVISLFLSPRCIGTSFQVRIIVLSRLGF